jgi:hypothetical protein
VPNRRNLASALLSFGAVLLPPRACCPWGKRTRSLPPARAGFRVDFNVAGTARRIVGTSWGDGRVPCRPLYQEPTQSNNRRFLRSFLRHFGKPRFDSSVGPRFDGGMPALARQKITFAEMRAAGGRGLLVYCSTTGAAIGKRSAAIDGRMMPACPIWSRDSSVRPAASEVPMSASIGQFPRCGRCRPYAALLWFALSRIYLICNPDGRSAGGEQG